MNKDWVGNKKSVYSCIGARVFAKEEREGFDYYATPPSAVKALLFRETFTPTILEPCVGGGHIAGVLLANGYAVISNDILDRGFPNTNLLDFFSMTENSFDIVTNPPYKVAKEFVEHAINISQKGNKIAMLLKLTFLEGAKRKDLFEKYPFKTLYVFSKRVMCAKNGDFEKYASSAVAYGWYVWEKGYKGLPVVKWI